MITVSDVDVVETLLSVNPVNGLLAPGASCGWPHIIVQV